MNESKDRINQFLCCFRDIIQENPHCFLSFDAIYYKLTHLGVSEGSKEINDNFLKWISYFKNDDNCKVYVKKVWRYFCQFISADKKALMANEHLKVYIPLDSIHIQRGAIEIFEFLSKEKIQHASKIGSHVRFDDIVVRLLHPEDLNKLLKFVKDNDYLQKGLIPANPFAFNINGIALASDGPLSYNSTIAMLIKLYLQEKKRSKTLNIVNADDFYEFIRNYHEKAFSNYNGLVMLKSDFDELEEEAFTIDTFVNYQNVLKLIVKTSNKGFSYNDYLNHYQECCNKEKRDAQKSNIQKIINSKVINNKENQSLIAKQDSNGAEPSLDYHSVEKDVISKINEILQVMGNKYGLKTALSNLKTYVTIGDNTYLTREDNLRDRIDTSSFRKDIKLVLEKRQIGLNEYLDMVYAILNKSDQDIYLEEAINETYKKYEKKYHEGLYHRDGKAHVVAATIQLIKDGVYYGFTRDNDARKNLEDHVPIEEVKKTILKGLDHNRLSSCEVNTMIEQYIERVLSNNIGKSL